MSKQTYGPRSAALIGTGWEADPADVHPVWEARTLPVVDRNDDWTRTEKVIFRFFFLYFLIQAVPLDRQFFGNLVDIDGNYTRYLFNLSHYAPRFVGSGHDWSAYRGPTDSFWNWLVVALIATIGTVLWTLRDTNRTNYPALWYGLRVVLRYRLALGVFAYGFIKLFPIQAPLPSISNLNTAYGDFTAWKLFSLSLGIVPSYQSFLGGVELLGGLLLLNRKTTTLGTLVLLPFLANVFFSNLAYEGGEYVYSGLLISFGLVLFAYDAVRVFRLVSLNRPALPNRFRPVFREQWQRYGRLALKGAFVLITVVGYGYSAYATYKKDRTATADGQASIRFPQTPGLPNVAGLYTVSTFRMNGQLIPYAKNHPTRWQDVVFETWNTISIKSNRPVTLLNTPTEQLPARDADRDYELAGTQGRQYYRYTADPDGRRLTLKNANPNQAPETLQLTVTKAGNGTLVLTGFTQTRDSIYAVLNKVDKKYLIDEAAKAGRRGSLTL